MSQPKKDWKDAAKEKLAKMDGSVYNSRLIGWGVPHQERVSLREQPTGVYVVRVVSQKRTLSGKVVLTR